MGGMEESGKEWVGMEKSENEQYLFQGVGKSRKEWEGVEAIDLLTNETGP